MIMHGVTGRMGFNQHLVRSICAIRAEGGVPLANGDRLMPDPVLIGRNKAKVEALARAHGLERWGDDLEAALENKEDTLFFDAGTTQMRAGLLGRAIDAGKHVYGEKPLALTTADAAPVLAAPRRPDCASAALRTRCSARASRQPGHCSTTAVSARLSPPRWPGAHPVTNCGILRLPSTTSRAAVPFSTWDRTT